MQRDAYIHGACNAVAGTFPVVLQGKLVKKPGWGSSKWQVRCFVLNALDRRLLYYAPSTGGHLGSIDLGEGALVRQVNDVGYGRKFEVRCASTGGKQRVYKLEASNVETRDFWTLHIQRVITGQAMLEPPSASIPAAMPASGHAPDSLSGFVNVQHTGAWGVLGHESSTHHRNFGHGAVSSDNSNSTPPAQFIEVQVPLKVPVPPGLREGAKLRVVLPPATLPPTPSYPSAAASGAGDSSATGGSGESISGDGGGSGGCGGSGGWYAGVDGVAAAAHQSSHEQSSSSSVGLDEDTELALALSASLRPSWDSNVNEDDDDAGIGDNDDSDCGEGAGGSSSNGPPMAVVAVLLSDDDDRWRVETGGLERRGDDGTGPTAAEEDPVGRKIRALARGDSALMMPRAAMYYSKSSSGRNEDRDDDDNDDNGVSESTVGDGLVAGGLNDSQHGNDDNDEWGRSCGNVIEVPVEALENDVKRFVQRTGANRATATVYLEMTSECAADSTGPRGGGSERHLETAIQLFKAMGEQVALEPADAGALLHAAVEATPVAVCAVDPSSMLPSASPSPVTKSVITFSV
eukprot:CAMPEP_0171698220 /NCGR_PEP_ID=MMETSP0991-20121206/9244_1 /TAXON_ID=483369 /ORGANISM="non described non described, Strain CCMP2098" /LENGTH=574 /DNA_ID=CAMNT_0012287077 /DNA_START=1 /DNA_END=1726 /DNA_ORIENTATION=+